MVSATSTADFVSDIDDWGIAEHFISCYRMATTFLDPILAMCDLRLCTREVTFRHLLIIYNVVVYEMLE